MKKLISFSSMTYDMDGFKNDSRNIDSLIKEYRVNGLEYVNYTKWTPEFLPADYLIGLHMSFWPIWLDFWKGNKRELLRQFGSEKTYRMYYGGDLRSSLVNNYRKELMTASEMGVEYVVFHVSHAQLEHYYNYKFTYSDDIVVSAFTEMMNEVLRGLKLNFHILFENLWWPGLTFLNKNIADKLLEGIEYDKKGLMLDIGHMMNTNLELTSEDEAADYIINCIDKLGGTGKYIKGIHLNSSLSGQYVKDIISKNIEVEINNDFFDKYGEACVHISNIDRHVPFMSRSINKVIKYVDPEYLVYEFYAQTRKDLEDYIKKQNDVLGL